MKATFYSTKSDNRKLRKDLSLVKEVNYINKSNDSVLNPIIVVDTFEGFEKVHYAFIEQYKRYYFVTDIQPIVGGRLQITLKVDVLQSYADAIANTQAIIERSSSYGNSYIVDNDIVLSNKPNYQTIAFPKSLDTTLHYVLIVSGY